MAASNAPGAFLVFFGGHLPQTSGFRSAKEILVVSFATQPRALILSDRNIFYNPGGGRTTAGSNASGAFLVFFLVVTCPRPPVFARLPFATQPRAFIFSDRNIFYTPGGEDNGGI